MRVTAGSAKGVRLSSVPGDTTRPILDRVRTALFDILRPQLPGMKLLDAFAGSGSVGIEALSQGAEHCIFLDLSKNAVHTINENLLKTKLQSSAEVRHADAFGYLKRTVKSFDLIYIAPPQYQSMWIEALRTVAERPELLREDGQVIVQIDPKEYEKLELSRLEERRQKRYGNTLLVFYEVVVK